MASNNLNTGGLEEAKEYMMTKEIPQLFESMMTALMYKKPLNHIQFLEECLEKAKDDPKVKWHSFIDPLPPIPKSEGKIRSERESVLPAETSLEDNILSAPLTKTLPPISSQAPKHNEEMVVESQNDTNVLAEKVLETHADTDDAVHDKVNEITEKVFEQHVSLEQDNIAQDEGNFEDQGISNVENEMEEAKSVDQPVEHKEAEAVNDSTTDIVESDKPWYAEYTEREIDTSGIVGKHVIFVLGGPGSGKGTQCAKIVEKYGFTHLSAGDLLRKEVSKGSDIGLKIDEIMKEGQLVPQDVTICLLKTAMVENPDTNGFLIDGFPREIKQGKQFERQVCLAHLVLNYDCADEVLMERLLARAEHSGRIDDNEESIKKRLVLFHEKTTPVIEHYDDIVSTIKADRDRDDVFADTCKAIELKVLGKVEITKPVIFVIGAPGSGKRTQCTKLSEKYGFAHFSTGELLKAEAEKENEVGEMLKTIITDGGELAPQDLAIGVLKEAMLATGDCNGYLISGFPREISQGVSFETEVCQSKLLLYYDCPDDILTARFMSRGPDGDNENIIMDKLQLFHSQTTPVILQYQEKVKVLDASKTIEQVFEDSCQVIDNLFSEPITQESEVLVESVPEILEIPEVPTLEETPAETEQKEDEPTEIKAPAEEEEIIVPIEEPIVGDYGQSNHIFKEEIGDKKVIVVLGGHGVSRHEKCAKIATDYDYTHIYSGDLIKEEIQSESERGALLNEMSSKGEFIPQSIMLELVSGALLKEKDKECFLIDGFPRNIQQAEQLESEITSPDLALYFSTPSLTMNEALAYDDSELLKNRIINFEEQTLPLVEMYRNNNILKEISAVDTEEVISQNIKTVLDKFEENRKMAKELEGKNIVFVLGGPGSGKGTQCEKIVEKYGFCHLSTGDLLREEVTSGTERAEKLKAVMARGELVSQDTILELLRDALIKNKDCKGFLIDGFPRDVPQGQKFEKTVGKCKFVLYFDCSNEVMVERLLGRAKTSGRVDDNEETIKLRLKTFNDQTLPVLGKFGDRVKKVNAERDVDDIFSDVCKVIDTST